MATESEADDFGKKISVITQHGFTALAIAYGSRLGLFEIMVKFSEPKTSQEIADAAGFKERSATCIIDYFLKTSLSGQRGITGLEIKIFSREPNGIFKSNLQVLCIGLYTGTRYQHRTEYCLAKYR